MTTTPEATSTAAEQDPPVQVLPVAEFITTFPPMYYAGSWQDIKDIAEAGNDDADPEDEYDAHFLASGTSGMDFDELVCSVEDDGILTPIDIENGEVQDGHHRVVAAMYAGKPVPFRIWS